MSKLEEYGYLFNKYLANVRKFSSGKQSYIKSEYTTNMYNYITILCMLCLFGLLYHV